MKKRVRFGLLPAALALAYAASAASRSFMKASHWPGVEQRASQVRTHHAPFTATIHEYLVAIIAMPSCGRLFVGSGSFGVDVRLVFVLVLFGKDQRARRR